MTTVDSEAIREYAPILTPASSLMLPFRATMDEKRPMLTKSPISMLDSGPRQSRPE